MVNIKKIIQGVILFFIGVVITIELQLCLGWSLATLAVPNEQLKITLDFPRQKEYVGMTVEECIELLGVQERAHWDSNCVSVYAGTDSSMEDGTGYIVLLYFNDERYVICTEIQEFY